jgi:hypothetical protein
MVWMLGFVAGKRGEGRGGLSGHSGVPQIRLGMGASTDVSRRGM